MWTLRRRKESKLIQQSRLKWFKEGDCNSGFFHRVIQGRRKSNEIQGLWIDGRFCEDVQDLKEGVKIYFENNFKEEKWNRPLLDGLELNSLNDGDNQFLIGRFTEEEIRKAVWSCGGEKSPEPDGFNFNFIKRHWEFLKEFVEFLLEFHKHGKLVGGSNPSFIVLIPKVENPIKSKDFRPISLIGSLYKVLAKLLANRLKVVKDKIISTSQSAFIAKRQIMDSVLILNEVLDEAKTKKKCCLVFKADFERAYDTVNWGFLDFMLMKLGFNEVWRKCMKECLSGASIAVLVNGSPTKESQLERGLRQGNPLSSVLFFIVAEGLSAMISRVVSLGKLKCVKVGRNEVEISHLQFADDTVVVSEASMENAGVIKAILINFELVSGLKVNY